MDERTATAEGAGATGQSALAERTLITERSASAARTVIADRISNVTVVRLRVPMGAADATARRLGLPSALRSSSTAECLALWIAPDQWLLVSERENAGELIEHHAAALEGTLHLLVDVSAALSCIRFQGPNARALLAMGSGLDWSTSSMPAGYSTRTRLAQIPAIVHATGSDRIDVYVDRSHRDYFERWTRRSMSDPLLRDPVCRNTY